MSTRHCFAALAAVMGLSFAAQAEISADRDGDKVTIKIDGKLFADYLSDSGGKPVVWPIVGPTGQAMTRAYPLEKVAGEKTDHIHHRSLWFTHGDVNGVDFWLEGAKGGKQKHKEFVRVQGGAKAMVVTRNDWVSPQGSKVLEDQRQLTFFATDESRVIDFEITLKATEGPVKFGDTKEGTFGVRVPETLRVEAKKGGRIVNSEDQIDDAANLATGPFTWGKRATWVDYSGPVARADGTQETVGIAILNHPSSFRFPTHWHVRTYGLFAANPFGLHDFENKPKGTGDHTLAAGDNVTFRYRVIFHRGDAKHARIVQAFDAYSRSDSAEK